MLADAKVSKAQIHGMSPYLLSLWLNERSLTYEASQWQGHGVGGVFHFILQTADADWAQRPAVYVFSEIDRASNTIRPWMYRVAAVRGGLYIESHDHYTERCTRDVIFNDATFNIAAHGYVELAERVEKELAALPFYNFFGIGFVHPWDRKLFSFHFSDDGKREDVLDSSGKLIPSIKALLDANFSKV